MNFFGNKGNLKNTILSYYRIVISSYDIPDLDDLDDLEQLDKFNKEREKEISSSQAMHKYCKYLQTEHNLSILPKAYTSIYESLAGIFSDDDDRLDKACDISKVWTDMCSYKECMCPLHRVAEVKNDLHTAYCDECWDGLLAKIKTKIETEKQNEIISTWIDTVVNHIEKIFRNKITKKHKAFTGSVYLTIDDEYKIRISDHKQKEGGGYVSDGYEGYRTGNVDCDLYYDAYINSGVSITQYVDNVLKECRILNISMRK